MAGTKWIGGVHAVEQALTDNTVVQLEVAANKKSKNVLAIVERAKAAGLPLATVENYTLDMRLPGVRHQGIAAEIKTLAKASTWQDAIAGIDKPLVLVLDGIQDPHNLGACLRSALAAGVNAVLIPNTRSADITPTVDKVSCGASEVLPIFRVANLKREVELMKQQGLWVVGGAGEEAVSLYSLDLRTPLVIIVGNEGEGIRFGLREACDYVAAIPMAPGMESLNVSVACGVMLFEARRQRLS